MWKVKNLIVSFSRPWNQIPIKDCGEPLQLVPSSLLCLEPHPYLSLGAPYQEDNDPWKLRSGVISRLIKAQDQLMSINSDFRLAIFDGWRPIDVQAFMVQHAIKVECDLRGLTHEGKNKSLAIAEVEKRVAKFWAPPSADPLMPPRLWGFCPGAVPQSG